jgi:hypothetical protein
MQLKTTQYQPDTGWAQPLPQALDSASTLVLAFGASGLLTDPRPFADLTAAFPQAVVMGCSTSGEISGSLVHDASMSVAVARFDHTRLHLATAVIAQASDSGSAGEQLAAELLAGGTDLRAVFVLSDGMCVNGAPLVDGLTRGLPDGVLVTGGLAGDGSRFEKTWLLVDGRPQPNRITAVGLYGDKLRVGRGCQGGWLDFGPERRITRSAGNVLYELDGKPALDLYKAYLGDLAQGLPGTALLLPLSIHAPGSDAKPLVRTILGIDEVQRSMTFAGEMPQGHSARLMRTTNEDLIDSAAAAGEQASQGLRVSGDALVVSVSCVGRRLVLGERTEEEVETILQGAPAGAGHVGFYSYGEISPGADGGVSCLHNQTMTVTVFGEG